jgi:hypothetical protein
LEGGGNISTVIYKLRVVSPRSRDAPQRNKAHTEYIARRRGAIRNNGMKHGLFGIVNGRKAEEVQNLRELSRHIEAKTREGAIAYRAVISLAETDAVRLGYDDPEKFRELVRARLPDMCEKIGIPIQNLEYAAAVHREKGHPHCHIIFWDKAQDVKKEAFVHPKTSNSIRIGLIKHVFAEESAALQEVKNEARKAALDKANGFFGEFAAAFADMTRTEYAEATERLKRGESDLSDGGLIYGRFNAADMRELAADLLRLCDIVPKTGRLNFKLMPSEVKEAVRAFTEKVLEKNADCDREFKRYVRAATELCEYYTDDAETHDKAGRTAYDDMMTRLGNAVLRAVKEINRGTRGAAREENRGTWPRQMTESLIAELFGPLARAAKAKERKLAHAYRAGELSKQAKKELAEKLEHSGNYDWG